MWDYHNDKLLQSLVIQYEFDFEKVAQFLNKNIGSTFDEENCRQRYTELYTSKQNGEVQMSPLQKLILQKSDKKKQQNTDKNIDFNLFHSQLLQEEEQRIKNIEDIKNKKCDQKEVQEKNFMSDEYVKTKQEQEKQFLESLQQNLSQIHKDKFQIYYLEQEGNKMAIKSADYNSKQGQVQRQKVLDSVKKYEMNFDKQFNRNQEQENLPIPSKYRLFSNLQNENQFKQYINNFYSSNINY